MRIAWMNEHILYFNGGIRYIYEVTRRLAKDNQVDVVVSDASASNIDKFYKAGVPITTFSTTSANSIKYWLLYPYYLLSNSKFLKVLLKDYDAVISTSPSTNILANLAGVKPIIVCYEVNPWLYNKEFIKGLSLLKRVIVTFAKPIASILDKVAFRNAKAVICHSKFVQSEIRRIYDVDSVVIPVGVDTEKFKKVELDNNNNIYNTYNKFNVILHVASYLSPMKGTKYAIEAMKWIVSKVPNALLLIITQDTKEMQDKLLKQATNFCNNVKFISNATDEDMISYYSLAKVHLQPSFDENAHYPAIEAGCAGCPTVGFSGKFECEDIVSNSTGFTVERYNSKELAVATVSILANPSLQGYLGRNAKQFMINKFGWNNYMEKLNAIINE